MVGGGPVKLSNGDVLDFGGGPNSSLDRESADYRARPPRNPLPLLRGECDLFARALGSRRRFCAPTR